MTSLDDRDPVESEEGIFESGEIPQLLDFVAEEFDALLDVHRPEPELEEADIEFLLSVLNPEK